MVSTGRCLIWDVYTDKDIVKRVKEIVTRFLAFCVGKAFLLKERKKKYGIRNFERTV